MMTRYFLYLAFSLLTACGSPPSPISSTTTTNDVPAPAGTALIPQVTPIEVSVRSYNGDLMEPFISPDGQVLLFNNSNDPAINTELHWAWRVNDELFDYQGLVSGVATSSLEGVPSLDGQGNLYFISTRSYPQTLSTVYRAQLVAGTGTGVELVSGLATAAPGRVIFDADISHDGQRLVLSEGSSAALRRHPIC
ncbi:PD40 domain-containing protein [bacterium]|nr:PD40 domain-containing protein [bacterium]